MPTKKRYFISINLLEKYITRLDNNEIAFLKQNPSDRRQVEKYIKELMAIIRHKKDPKREEKQLEMAMHLWRILMINAFRQISISYNIRGFGDLYAYYKKTVGFENVLFGIQPTYRDHTMHALWVYILGDFIRHSNAFLGGIDIDWRFVLGDEPEACQKRIAIETSLKDYEDAIFCIIALGHDLAYPFEKVENVNQRLADLSRHMGIQSFTPLRCGFSMEQSLLINELIELTSQKLVITSKGHCIFVKDDPTFVDMTQSFEQRKHGILSAYLLYRLVDTMGEITFSHINELPHSDEKIRQLIPRQMILYTIASHTCDYAYSSRYNLFRFLLCLVDELEEFSRYKRLGRSAVDEICKVSLEAKKNGDFTVTYLFEKKHEAEPKRFFKDRAIRFCRMIEINNDVKAGKKDAYIRRMKLFCIDEKSARRREYCLRIDKNGISCKLSGHGRKWHELHPDPENNLNDLLDRTA